MISFKNEIEIPHDVRLREVDYGWFFEFDHKIYQKLSWDESSEQFNCLELSSMCNDVKIRYDKYVRPVDVEITVTGYTKEDC